LVCLMKRRWFLALAGKVRRSSYDLWLVLFVALMTGEKEEGERKSEKGNDGDGLDGGREGEGGSVKLRQRIKREAQPTVVAAAARFWGKGARCCADGPPS
jgi:hypothetical protein